MGAPFIDSVQLEGRALSDLLPKPFPTPILSLPIPLPGRPNTTQSTTTTTTTSASSTSLTSTSTSSETSTTPSTTTSSSSTSTTPEPSTNLPISQVTGQPRTHTVTDFSSSTGAAVPPPTATPASFLQNKVLSGVVFAIVGVVSLVIIIMVATFFIRRRRNKKLIEEAINFDPVSMGSNYADALEEGKGTEKLRISSSSSSAGGHGDVSWTTMPVTGYSNQYAVGPGVQPSQAQQYSGQPYAPPPSWGAPRYLPPSQLYRPQETNNSYPGASAPGY